MKNAAACLLSVVCVFLVGALPGSGQQDPPHVSCCFWIYSAGTEMGILTSALRSERASDAEIILLLFRLGEWIQRAHIFCPGQPGVWDGYGGIRAALDRFADNLADGAPRARSDLSDFLIRMERDFASALKGWKAAGPGKSPAAAVSTDSCEQWYFLIGFQLGAAHRSFQLAALRPDTEEGLEARFYGLDHVVQALDALHSLGETRPETGRCIPLWSERMTLMETMRDVADELSRPEGRYSPLQLLGKVWEARRETAAVFGDPGAGPVPPGIGGCAGTEEVLTTEGKKAQARRWLGDTGRLKERLARPESPLEEGSGKENREAAVSKNKGKRAKGRFLNWGDHE